MSDKREKDLEKARQYLVATENAGKSLPEILIGFAEKQTTSQQQTIERLREVGKNLLDYCSEYLNGKKSLAEAQKYRPDGEKYRPNILEDIKEMESKLREAEQLLNTTEQ